MRHSVFILLCAATALVLFSTWPASRARADDDQGGDDSCGGALVAGDDNQGDDNAQGDENGCGMVVVEVDDENGDEVDDMNDNGTPDDDVDVDVDALAKSGVNDGSVVHLQTAQNGSFVLKGLPKGKVTITATRVHDGVTTTRTKKAGAREGRTRHVRLRLRTPH